MQLPDYSELLAPFPGDNPSGETLDYTIKTRLDDNRKSIDPNDYDENDPQRPTEPKYADWEDIAEVCWATLAEKTKDLNLAVRLTEAITRISGFPGLKQGLEFLLAYVEQCWEFTYPFVETEEDLELRAGPFNWLSDPQRGSRFPTTLRMLPIIASNTEEYSVIDWINSNNPNAEITFDVMNKAISRMSQDLALENWDALRESTLLIQQLQNKLNDLMGPYSPSLIAIRQAIEECAKIAEGITKKISPAASSTVQDSDVVSQGENGEAQPESSQTDQTWNPKNARAARDAIYDRLRKAADMLIELEPHSPIPYLIRKAVELGELSYPQLMTRLLEDTEALNALRKEFGLPEE